MILKAKNTSLINLLGALLIISVLFIPDIQFGSGLPAFQVIDFALPLILILIYIGRSNLLWNKYYLIFILFCFYITVTSVINGRITVLNDYFEVYKIFKFFVLILLFSMVDRDEFLKTWVKPIFAILVGINFLHFYNIFEINTFLFKFYNQGIQIEYFGLNSLKEPAVKRMIGMSSNPNVNSVIFTFFAIYFMPLKFDKKKFFWFLTAVLMLFLCQSRTGLLAFGFILIAVAILRLSDWNWKQWLMVIFSTTGMFLISWAMVTSFFKFNAYSVSLLDASVLTSNSARGRWEAWNFLGKMILDKPIFGHSPNKGFFYENKLYSENEYILMTWRYGIVGLFLYLFILLYPLQEYIRARKNNAVFKYGILILILILVTALTNNPFTDRTINLLLACTIGLIIPDMKGSKKFFK